MNPAIRRARAGDIAGMSALEQGQPFSLEWGVKGISSELENSASLVLVCELEAGIAGFAAARIIAPELQIVNLVVSPQRLRRGIAASLIGELLRIARLESCSFATLEVDATNEPAAALYAKLGFKAVGRRPKFYDGKRDAVLMNLSCL